MKKPELLSPAGNRESLEAAIKAGCDAVYLGGTLFGARSYAGNFDNDELVEAIKYAHLYGVKVYVTVNTIIYENEVEDFINFVRFIHQNNVDAIIIQDLGMMDLIRKKFPNLEIHASTQMNVHNIEGVKLLKDLGLKRVVLARETPIELIEEIKKQVDIELEIFIQGALCVSYSGECLMSSLIGGRSGNRGSCAQCCRMPYDLISNNQKINKDKYLLSTKDLNTLTNLDKLIENNVDSLKIEGRMKRPEYVYLMTSIYRKAIDNYFEGKELYTNKDIKEMQKIFNREFTKGFIFDEENDRFVNQKRPNHIGIKIGEVIDYQRGKVKIKLEDSLNLGDGIRIISGEDIGFTVNNIYLNKKQVSKANKGDIIEIPTDNIIKKGVVHKTTDKKQIDSIDEMLKENKKISIKGFIKAKLNDPFELSITDGINEVRIEECIIEQSLNTGTSKERIIEQIKKIGNSPFIFEELYSDIDENIFIKISDLNEIKRKAINELINKRIYQIPFKEEEYDIELSDYPKEENYNVLLNVKDQYEKIEDKKINSIYLEEELYNQIEDQRKVLKLPRVNFNLKENNNLILIGDLGSLYKYQYKITDFGFNVTNSYTVAFLHSLNVQKITLSYELNDNQIKDLIDGYHKRYHKHPNLELIISSYPEAMISKFKLLSFYNIKDGYLKDKYNNLFKVKENNDLMTIYHYEKKELYNDYFKIGINNLRIHIEDDQDINLLDKYIK